jgi:hypothetical protein
MKKNVVLLILIIGVAGPLSADAEVDANDPEITSRSHLTNMADPFHRVAPELISMFRHDKTRSRDSRGGALEFAVYGSKTTNHEDTAFYFLPTAKKSPVVGEQFFELTGATNTDILAQHFNIITVNDTFESVITFDPEQTMVGFGVAFRHSFWHCKNKSFGLWWSVIAPVNHVKNNLNFVENEVNDGGGPDLNKSPVAVANMKEAFNQESWKFSKIRTGDQTQKTTRLADIELRLGYEWLQHDPYHLETYAGILIPTGNRSNGEFLWEAISGFGKHFGLMFGNAYGLTLCCNEEEQRELRFEYASHSLYLFKKKEVRSIDLKNKPWSRFIEVYESQEQAQEAALLALSDPIKAQFLSTPGINVFTQPVDVTPGFSLNLNLAFTFIMHNLYLEGGYNFLARKSEKVELAGAWLDSVAIKHQLGAGQTSTIRDITGNIVLETATMIFNNNIQPIPLTNYAQAIIKESDLDFNSAATPSTLAHTLYANLGYACDNPDCPVFAGIGASYVFGRNNNVVPQRWMVWGKAGISF